MANELGVELTHGLTVYALIFNPQNFIWNTSTLAFESPLSTSWTNYAVAMTEIDNSGVYEGNFPSGITSPAIYHVNIKTQAGGSPVVGDTLSATGDISWSGSTVNTGGTYLISLAEYKAMFNITSTTYDNQINALIPAIADEIDTYINGHVISADYSEVYNGTGNNFLRLRNVPVSNITSITVDYNCPTAKTYTGDNLMVDTRNSFIYWKPSVPALPCNFPYGKLNIQVIYTAGYDSASVPQRLKLAAGRYLYIAINQSAPNTGINSKSANGVSVSYGHNRLDINQDMFQEVRDILDKYTVLRYIF